MTAKSVKPRPARVVDDRIEPDEQDEQERPDELRHVGGRALLLHRLPPRARTRPPRRPTVAILSCAAVDVGGQLRRAAHWPARRPARSPSRAAAAGAAPARTGRTPTATLVLDFRPNAVHAGIYSPWTAASTRPRA